MSPTRRPIRSSGNGSAWISARRPTGATPISLVQHQYFNLGTTDNVLDHRYRFNAGAYTELGELLIPTGNILEATPGT